jgi:hypothetical protein
VQPQHLNADALCTFCSSPPDIGYTPAQRTACLRRGICRTTLDSVHSWYNRPDVDIACPRRGLCTSPLIHHTQHSCHNPRDIDIACLRRVLRTSPLTHRLQQTNHNRLEIGIAYLRRGLCTFPLDQTQHPYHNPRDIHIACPRRVLCTSPSIHQTQHACHSRLERNIAHLHGSCTVP